MKNILLIVATLSVSVLLCVLIWTHARPGDKGQDISLPKISRNAQIVLDDLLSMPPVERLEAFYSVNSETIGTDAWIEASGHVVREGLGSLQMRNAAANLLHRLDRKNPLWLSVFYRVQQDRSNDHKWRDYAIQFIGAWLDDHELEASRLLRELALSNEIAPTLAATAMLQLAHGSRQKPYFFDHHLYNRCVEWVDSSNIERGVKITASGIIGMMDARWQQSRKLGSAMSANVYQSTKQDESELMLSDHSVRGDKQ